MHLFACLSKPPTCSLDILPSANDVDRWARQLFIHLPTSLINQPVTSHFISPTYPMRSPYLACLRHRERKAAAAVNPGFYYRCAYKLQSHLVQAPGTRHQTVLGAEPIKGRLKGPRLIASRTPFHAEFMCQSLSRPAHPPSPLTLTVRQSLREGEYFMGMGAKTTMFQTSRQMCALGGLAYRAACLLP